MKKNSTLEFVKIIIKCSMKEADRNDMTLEQKKDFVNKKVLEYFEKERTDLEEMTTMYQEACTDFPIEDFVKYVITHTSNINIIFGEKLKLEPKLKKISKEIKEIESQIYEEDPMGYVYLCGSTPDLFSTELANVLSTENQFLSDCKISNIRSKYQIIDPTLPWSCRRSRISIKQLEENIEIIEGMINSCSSVEQLYEMVIEQKDFFLEMGEEYEGILRERSPELFEYIDTLIQREIIAIKDKIQDLLNRRNELKQLQQGLAKRCGEYDKRLPEELRGTEEQREALKSEKEFKERIKERSKYGYYTRRF